MQLLTEKYRPKKLEDLVIINEEFGKKLKDWIEKKTIDSHLMLYGTPGTGKTSTISVILNELEISDYTIINASDKTGIDDTRRIIEYAAVPPIEGNLKIIVYEEFDRLSPQAQDSLKYIMEQYSGWCRFIFTTNTLAKISPAIISRCQTYVFNTIDKEKFVERIVKILYNEKIFNDDTTDQQLAVATEYVNVYYPDLRKCINAVLQNIVNGKLLKLNDTNYITNKFEMVIQNLNNSTKALKKIIMGGLSDNDIIEFYRYMYNNLDKITPNENKWGEIIIKIADYMYKDNTVAYPDLNLVACLVEIKNILNNEV